MDIASGNQYRPLYDRRKRVQALRAHRRAWLRMKSKLRHLIPPAVSSLRRRSPTDPRCSPLCNVPLYEHHACLAKVSAAPWDNRNSICHRRVKLFTTSAFPHQTQLVIIFNRFSILVHHVLKHNLSFTMYTVMMMIMMYRCTMSVTPCHHPARKKKVVSKVSNFALFESAVG